MLPLIAKPVVSNTEVWADDVLEEGSETDIEVVGYDMWVVLDVRPHDLLAGPVVARQVVCEPREVSLEAVPLHIGTAEGHKGRGSY